MKKFLPSKNNIYNFLFNLILLTITLVFGNFYINHKLLIIDQNKLEQKNLIEKKNEFIKNFTKLGQSKIYLSENYYYNKINSEEEHVLSRSWENYMNSIAMWNSENLLNPIFIKYYFGEKMQDRFYNNLLPKFTILHMNLLNIRDGKEVDNMEDIIEDAKHELFIFSEDLMFKK